MAINRTIARPAPAADGLSDAEISGLLKQYRPTTSERNVWAFWDNGFDALRPWMKQNVINWVRLLGPTWTVRVTDMVPGSPNHVFNYVPTSYFPDAFVENRIDGARKGQHASDIARLPLIYEHGGVYMDVGVLLFRSLDDICWAELEHPESRFEVGAFALQARKHFGQIITSFIASRKGNPFVAKLLTMSRVGHTIYLHLWRDRTNLIRVHKDPLISHLGLLRFDDDPTFGENPDWEDFTDYASHSLAYERLRLIREPGNRGFDGSAYFQKHFFLLDAWSEMFLHQDELDGATLFNLLSLQREPDENTGDEKQQAARKLCESLLENSCMAKFSSGFWQPGMPLALTHYWGRHEHASCDPNTWAGYLRHGSVHLEQLRHRGKCLLPLEIPEEKDEALLDEKVFDGLVDELDNLRIRCDLARPRLSV